MEPCETCGSTPANPSVRYCADCTDPHDRRWCKQANPLTNPLTPTDYFHREFPRHGTLVRPGDARPAPWMPKDGNGYNRPKYCTDVWALLQYDLLGLDLSSGIAEPCESLALSGWLSREHRNLPKGGRGNLWEFRGKKSNAIFVPGWIHLCVVKLPNRYEAALAIWLAMNVLTPLQIFFAVQDNDRNGFVQFMRETGYDPEHEMFALEAEAAMRGHAG